MDGAHKALDDAKLVMDDFGNGGETISCARCIGYLTNKSDKTGGGDVDKYVRQYTWNHIYRD